MQGPLIAHINDNASTWASLWRQGSRLGMVPYYMFVERDTGARNYFEVPLAEAHAIFRDAFCEAAGTCQTVRGPSMSTSEGKVQILGVTEIPPAGEQVFVLTFLQHRNPEYVGIPFFAKYDDTATWFDQLQPADGFECANRRFFNTN